MLTNRIPQLKLPAFALITMRLVLLFLLFSITRTAFYLYNLDLFPRISASELALIYGGGLRFDLTAILYLNSLYIVLQLLPLRSTYKPWWQCVLNIWFVFSNSLGLAANLFDAVYFPFTLRRTTVDIFKVFKNEQGLFSIFLNGLADFWPVTLLLIGLIVLLVLIVRATRLKPQTSASWWFYPFRTGLLLLIMYFMVIGIRGGFGKYTRPLGPNDAGRYVKNVDHMALVLNTPFTILRNLNQKSFKYKHDFSPAELVKIYNPEFSPDSQRSRPVNKKNVVILVLESFGRELSGVLNPQLDNGTYHGYVPFLDSLMQRSLTFSNAFSAGRKSIDAIPAIISGIPYLKSHYVISNYSTNKLGGLAHILNEQGYQTAFFHGAPNGSMGFDAFTNLAGIQRYYGMTEFENDDLYDGSWGIWDEEFLQFVAQVTDTTQQPFCHIFFSLSSHHPWDLPDRYKGKFRKGPRNFLYCVQYADMALRKFFETVQKMDWYQNTLFVITADHGAYHYIDAYKTAVGEFRIPMLFFTPDGSLPAGFDERVAKQTDIFPTILDYLGIAEPYVAFGHSLLDSSAAREAYYFSRNSYKIINDSLALDFDGHKNLALYRYKQDPLLVTNFLDQYPTVADSMQRKLRAVIQQYNNRMLDDRLVPEN